MHATILDCTLRDGGYINNWSFPKEQTLHILQSLVNSGIDVVECGFISQQKGRPNSTCFPDVASVNAVLSELQTDEYCPLFVAMINVGEVQVETLPPCEPGGATLQGIRLAFHKKQQAEALQQAERLIEKGYRLFVQPMLTVGYSDREILDLLEAFHPLAYYAMYIVDSFGSMSGDQFRRYHALFEHNLKAEAKLGYHSHNNLQLAYANAITFLDLAHGRDIILDASVLGMGRGAGNLNTELLAGYMNERLHTTYQIDPLLEVIDSSLEAIKRESPWGYSIAHFLSARLNCHPNYAGFLLRKKNLSVRNIHELLASIPIEERVRYDETLISEIYTASRRKLPRKESFKASLFTDTPIILLASGSNARDAIKRIQETRKTHGALLVALNHVPDFLEVDYVFMSNQKRYDEFLELLDANRLVASTHLDVKENHRSCQRIDGQRLLEESFADSDNVALQCLGFLKRQQVQDVFLAGLDGYSPQSTALYSYEERGGILDPELMQQRNQELEQGVREASEHMKLQFLSESRFETALPLRICGVIPARYESSRFEGKPLALIAGVPMLKRTYDQARMCQRLETVIVATDDERIRSYCEQEEIPCMMTSGDCLTGTDRVAEVMRRSEYDLYVNIQGDEPVISPETIDQVIDAFLTHRDAYIAYNLYKRLDEDEPAETNTLIKVIVNEQDELMYMSRHAVPFEKGVNRKGFLKQVCVYGFTRAALELFSSTGKSPVEASEDIEILRFLEKGHPVLMQETEHDSIAVDVPEDIAKVEAFLARSSE